MAADIFISFASKDVKVALTLCQAIESRGYKCWISARDIQAGENFQVAIVQALRRAKILLLVFTANSNTSEEMTKELALASQQKMMVIPLRVEDVTPGDAFAYEFATRQWIDAFADWEFSIEQLCRRIGHALERGEDHEVDAVVSTVAPRAAETAVEPAPAPPPKPAPAKAAKPEPAPPPKAKPAPKPAEAVNDAEDDEAPRASGARRLMVAGLILAVMAGVGITATMLLRPKNEAVAAAPPAQAVAIAPVDVAAVPAPVEVVEAEPEPVVEAAPKPKPRRRQATQQATTGPVDIPY